MATEVGLPRCRSWQCPASPPLFVASAILGFVQRVLGVVRARHGTDISWTISCDLNHKTGFRKQTLVLKAGLTEPMSNHHMF